MLTTRLIKTIQMNMPSGKRPGPKGPGHLPARRLLLLRPSLRALHLATAEEKLGPARGRGGGRAEEPAPGRKGRGDLTPLGDPASSLPHHHGHLGRGALGESDAVRDGGGDLQSVKQGLRDPDAREVGDERRGRCPDSCVGAALSPSGRAEKKPSRAHHRATSELFFGPRAEVVAFAWRWAEALVC